MHAWHAPQPEISRAGQAFTAPGPQAISADAARQLTALLSGWRAKYPDVLVTQELAHGHPGRALVGLSARADVGHSPGADVREALEVNLLGTWRVTAAALPALLNARGTRGVVTGCAQG